MAQQDDKRPEHGNDLTGGNFGEVMDDRELQARRGTISDQAVEQISGGENDDRPTGQDHSLENYEDSEPTDGVGAIQDSSLIKEDIAHIEE